MSFDNILVLNLSHIGDILFTTPMLRALRQRFPSARINVVVLEGMEDILKYNPNVDELITRRHGIENSWKLIKRARLLGADASILCSTSAIDMGMVQRFSGATTRVGFAGTDVSVFQTNKVPFNKDCHVVECYLDLAKELGAKIENPRIEMFVGDEERSFASDLLMSNGVSGDRPIAALCPGSSVHAKAWFADRYAEVVDRLSADGFDVVLMGSSSEEATIDEVLRVSKSNPINLSMKTGIGQLAGLFDQCNVVISNDTGPMHLAVGVGTPVVAIFGPTTPNRYGPFTSNSTVFWQQKDCSPCGYEPTCTSRDCLSEITADAVSKAAVELGTRREAK